MDKTCKGNYAKNVNLCLSSLVELLILTLLGNLGVKTDLKSFFLKEFCKMIFCFQNSQHFQNNLESEDHISPSSIRKKKKIQTLLGKLLIKHEPKFL